MLAVRWQARWLDVYNPRHRAEVRASAMADPQWQAFLGKANPPLFHMTATILTPATFSPLQ